MEKTSVWDSEVFNTSYTLLACVSRVGKFMDNFLDSCFILPATLFKW